MATRANNWEDRIGRRLKLRDLHILSAVVQWGSMAKAATHLSMTQPAISDAIASLEGALGVRLLDRSSRGVEPTIYTNALLKRGLVVFDELRQGIRDIEFLANPTAGECESDALRAWPRDSCRQLLIDYRNGIRASTFMSFMQRRRWNFGNCASATSILWWEYC
jgi:hypothetical protein